jgi:UDP-N-acetylmuramoyl-L-alanyl-D-glutamate--2,6-diaminopimelate ligase
VSQLLDHLGVNNGFIGTLGISNNDDKKLTVSNTTPDIFTLYRALEDYHSSDINMAVVEVSSHSIHQNRISGLNFTQAIFTNLTQDHLDYHGTLKEYKRIKGKLFSLDSIETVIINKDDANCKYFLEQSIGKKIVTFRLSDFQSYRPNNNGFLCQIENYIFETSMLGEFNLSNILAAINSVEQLGFDIGKVIPLIAKLRPPAGRMHKINKSLVWVDYAHTPDAISNAIATLNQHYPEHKVRIVFGCGGSRDKDKRAKMGKIASKNANTIILTNDNPREEDPNDIIDDISSGIVDGTKVDVILDRRLAIETAVATLKEDECLLIAGKGHESVQQFKDRVINFNDIEIAQNAAI